MMETLSAVFALLLLSSLCVLRFYGTKMQAFGDGPTKLTGSQRKQWSARQISCMHFCVILSVRKRRRGRACPSVQRNIRTTCTTTS